MKASSLLVKNVQALLHGRRERPVDLAKWCGHSQAWLSAILAGKREFRMPDLDRIADFFGVATYQLLQPGISALTERRHLRDRRTRDRRIGHQQRAVLHLSAEIAAAHPKMDGSKFVLSPQERAVIEVLRDESPATTESVLDLLEVHAKRRRQSKAGRTDSGKAVTHTDESA